MNQVTISEPVTVSGVNVFNGKKSYAVFHPSEDNSGLSFIVNGESIPVNIDKARNYKSWRALRFASCIAIDGERERAIKVEHLLSAIYALGIDNLAIELSDGVVPRQNNSVSEIVGTVAPLRIEGNVSRKYLTVKDGSSLEDRTVVRKGRLDKLSVHQAKGFWVSYDVYFPHKVIGEQHYELELTAQNYMNEIMKSRGIFFLPFGSRFLIDSFLKNLHGITDSNALFIGSKSDETFANTAYPEGIYGKEEFVRHKVLDAIGAIALTGKRFKDTEFRFDKTGHAFDIYALKTLMQRGCFESVE